MGGAIRSWLSTFAKWVRATLRADAYFWLSLLAALGGLQVPQIWQVVTQTVQAPALSSSSSWADIPALLGSRSTLGAAGFLTFLSLLATAMAASVLFVVPPSFVATADNPADPIRLPRPPRRALILVAVFLLALLPVFVLLPIPPLVLMAVTAVLLFTLVSRWVRSASAWPLAVAASLSSASRRSVGIVLGLVGLLITLAIGAAGHSSRLYPLAGSACQLFGGLGLVAGVWLATIPSAVGAGADDLGPVRTAVGRWLGWLVIVCVVGELAWAAATAPVLREFVSYRLYTIWAALTLPAFLVITASLVDTWDGATGYPVRLVGLVGLAIVIVVAARPEPLRPFTGFRGPAVASEEWAGHLLERVRRVPPGEPVVFVAAAGGGSRAAIFAGLVLESLAREPFPGRPGDTWADHVVLISGVSGGSLATATYVHRLDKLAAGLRGGGATSADVERADLRNSVKAELIVRMEEEAQALIALVKDQAAQGGEVPAKEYLDACDDATKVCHELRTTLLSDQPPPTWVLQSALMDDLCTDFMAPVLRGAVTPGISRAQGLRHFWGERFGWGDSSDRGGYGWARGAAPRFDPAIHPLVILNATDVRRGCRLAVGFPPLPPGFLAPPAPRPGAAAPGEHEDTSRLHYPPETMADVAPDHPLRLADAVGLSANFPFGFNAATLPRIASSATGESEQYLSERDDRTAKILDGGIVDNTGIDTLFLVTEAVRARARAAGPNNVYADLWRALADRRIVLVEIDSGAKPQKPGMATRWLSAFLDPLDSLTNASYTNATLATQRYLGDVRTAYRLPVDLAGPMKRAGDDREAWAVLSEWQTKGVDRFIAMRYDANHFNGDNVLTAWSLGPRDKALLLVRFLVELQLARKDLSGVGRLPRLTADQERARVVKEANDLVDRTRDYRGNVRQEQALKRLAHDLDEVGRLKKEGVKSKDALLGRLKTVEDGAAQIKQQAGDQPGAASAGLNQRLEDVQKAARATRVALERGELPAEAAFRPLTVPAGGPLGTYTASVSDQVRESEKTAQRLRAGANPQERLQADFDRRARESKKLFDAPPPKKPAAPPATTILPK